MMKNLPTHSLQIYFFIATVFLTCYACKDFVEIDPPRTEIVSETVFEFDETLNAALSGMYHEMNSFQVIFSAGLEMYTTIASDEIQNTYVNENVFVQFATNDILPSNDAILTSFWRNCYRLISLANSIVSGVSGNSNIDPSLRDQARGEALFVRALHHFYLTNLFGDVPYINSNDIAVNNIALRDDRITVLENVRDDLLQSIELLPVDFTFFQGQPRVRPCSGSASALLARTYLYLEDWSNAALLASQVIENQLFSLENSPNDVFLGSSQEVIWQLGSRPGFEGKTRIADILAIGLLPPGISPPLSLGPISDGLKNAFEEGDLRSEHWIGTTTFGAVSYDFSFKYKNTVLTGFTDIPEYHIILRLGEQYLIRAEARAQLNNIEGAQADLNVIRTRAGLPDTNAISRETLLDAIMQERRIELFTEMGHRWMDLKRTGKINETLAPIKGSWQPTDALWPIPEIEIFNNSNLTQNPGY